MAKIYTLTIQNRVAALILLLALLGLGAVFLTVGLALVAGLAVGGGVIGAGYSLLRRLRGSASRSASSIAPGAGDLNPRLEVSPTRPAIIGPVEKIDKE